MISPFILKDIVIEKFVIIFSGAYIDDHKVFSMPLMKVLWNVFDRVPVSGL